MTLKIGELNLRCKDVEKSLNFYQQALGFELVEREGDCARIQLDDRQLLLMPLQEGESPGVSFDLMYFIQRNSNVQKFWKFIF